MSAVQIQQCHLCKVPDKITEYQVAKVAKFFETDIAIELRGENVHLFAVSVRVKS